MRLQPDFEEFCDQYDWYRYDKELGYVPTEICPEYAQKAIERFNKKNNQLYDLLKMEFSSMFNLQMKEFNL